jgi:hypothetical protein
MLDEANNLHSNIKLVRQVDASVTFLGAPVNKEDDQSSLSVYHEEAANPYVLPFVSDQARRTFENIVHNAFCRVVRYSPTLEAFNNDRHHIKLMLLYNG